MSPAPLALFSGAVSAGSAGCGVGSVTSLPAHSLILVLHTLQPVLILPTAHLSVQEQAGTMLSPSLVKASRSASSTRFRKWTFSLPLSSRSMMR